MESRLRKQPNLVVNLVSLALVGLQLSTLVLYIHTCAYVVVVVALLMSRVV